MTLGISLILNLSDLYACFINLSGGDSGIYYIYKFEILFDLYNLYKYRNYFIVN